MERQDRLLNGLLVSAALAVGGWALWPHVRPVPRAPVVTVATLPASAAPVEEIAPSYPVTSSVEPLLNGPLNLNTATREQIEALPRIGPALAERIVANRPYRALQDLDRVKGVGPRLLQTLAPLVTF